LEPQHTPLRQCPAAQAAQATQTSLIVSQSNAPLHWRTLYVLLFAP
jgi:hypothetical protein